jgi:hypothetical protein
VKVKRGGTVGYSLPDQVAHSDWAAARLQRIFAEWVQSVEAAGTMLVLKTPPGSAHLVGLALDQAKLEEVAGTISGDDTFVRCAPRRRYARRHGPPFQVTCAGVVASMKKAPPAGRRLHSFESAALRCRCRLRSRPN